MSALQLIKKLCRHKSVAFSLFVIVSVVFASLFASWIATYDPNKQFFEGLTNVS